MNSEFVGIEWVFCLDGQNEESDSDDDLWVLVDLLVLKMIVLFFGAIWLALLVLTLLLLIFALSILLLLILLSLGTFPSLPMW